MADIEGLRQRIEDSEICAPGDRERLLECLNEMGRHRDEWQDERRHSVVQRLIMLAWGGDKYPTNREETENYHVGENYWWHGTTLSAALENREDAERLVDWINARYKNEETNRDMRNALRVFGKVLTNRDPTNSDASPPPSLDWISATTPSNYKPRPNPADMLKWQEDVKPMCKHPETNPRDAALLAVAWDAGPRSGELQELTVGDISDRPRGKIIRVNGKTGPRSVTITTAAPYLRQWLNQHPAPDDPDAPLWSKLKKNEQISYRMFRDIFIEAANRVGLQKPDTPTNFRKSSISAMVGELKQHELEDRYGWETGSDAASRYIAVFSKERERAVLKARGIEPKEDEPEPTGPTPCERCGELVDRDGGQCDNCGFIRDRERAQEEINTHTEGANIQELVHEAVKEELSEMWDTADVNLDPQTMGEVYTKFGMFDEADVEKILAMTGPVGQVEE